LNPGSRTVPESLSEVTDARPRGIGWMPQVCLLYQFFLEVQLLTPWIVFTEIRPDMKIVSIARNIYKEKL
jgi:hypothetical protein